MFSANSMVHGLPWHEKRHNPALPPTKDSFWSNSDVKNTVCQKWKIVQFRFLFLFFKKTNAKFGYAKLFYLFLPIFSLIHHLFFIDIFFSLPSIFILMPFFSHLDWTWLSCFADFLNIVPCGVLEYQLAA